MISLSLVIPFRSRLYFKSLKHLNLWSPERSDCSDQLRWFAQGYYTVAEHEGKIRLYNMQCDMQEIRTFGNYKAPTAFYYEITPKSNGKYELDVGMQEADKN